MSDEKPRDTRPLPGDTWLDKLSSKRAMTILAVASVLLLALAGLAGWYLLKGVPGVPEVSALETPPTSLNEIVQKYPELGKLLGDPKLDSVYKDFLLAYQTGGAEAAYDLAHKRGLLNDQDQLVLTLELDTRDTAPIQAELEGRGILVTAVSDNLMDIAIPLDLLEQALSSGHPEQLFAGLAALDHILRIRLPIIGIQDVGDVETESLGVINVDAWHQAGFTGKGIRIGILDMGFDRYRDLLGSDLPENVTVRSFIAGKDADEAGTPHGTAVAEIVHDIAPDAELFFAPYKTDVEERQAVEWLLSQGVDIIQNSTGSIYGPMDGSSYDVQVVEDAVANGVLWVNSAGNSGFTHYRGTFTDDDGDGYHEFAPGDEMMAFIPSGWTVLALNWDDWLERTQDYDLLVMDGDGNEIASSTNLQNGPGSDAAEILGYQFSDEGPYYVVIYRKSATRDVLFDFFLRDGEIEYYTPEYSITTPGDAPSSLTVGATDWSSDRLEDYSSRGPTQDERMKPDILAPSGVSSAAYGDTWIGTSASAPHVSGAAALVLQANPDFTPQQVKDFLLSRADSLGQQVPNNEYGYGRLWLGDPPDAQGAPPLEPTPSEEPAVSTDTPEPEPEDTLVPEPTATERQPKLTPSSSSGASSGMAGAALLLAGCVIVPGALGLAGIGLLLAVVYAARSRRPAPPPYFPPREPTAVMPPMPRDAPAGQPYRPAPPPVAPTPAPPPPPAVQEAPPAPLPAALVTCPQCSSPNQPTARFCTKCGYDMKPPEAPAGRPAFCRNCGKPLRSNSKFCSSCGKEI